mmetsp:Transcript_12134/g.36043  ORF Transcript_12134/g.36043 Transcript_12134/m.36043 type:complete len:405 (+) Transcript_12134:1177-2391(+)
MRWDGLHQVRPGRRQGAVSGGAPGEEGKRRRPVLSRAWLRQDGVVHEQQHQRRGQRGGGGRRGAPCPHRTGWCRHGGLRQRQHRDGVGGGAPRTPGRGRGRPPGLCEPGRQRPAGAGAADASVRCRARKRCAGRRRGRLEDGQPGGGRRECRGHHQRTWSSRRLGSPAHWRRGLRQPGRGAAARVQARVHPPDGRRNDCPRRRPRRVERGQQDPRRGQCRGRGCGRAEAEDRAGRDRLHRLCQGPWQHRQHPVRPGAAGSTLARWGRLHRPDQQRPGAAFGSDADVPRRAAQYDAEAELQGAPRAGRRQHADPWHVLGPRAGPPHADAQGAGAGRGGPEVRAAGPGGHELVQPGPRRGRGARERVLQPLRQREQPECGQLHHGAVLDAAAPCARRLQLLEPGAR